MAPTELGRTEGAHQPPRAPLRIGPLRIRRWRLWLIPAALLVLNVVAAQALAPHAPEPTVIPYSAFKQQVQAGNVAEITTRGDAIQGTFRGAGDARFETRAPTFPDPGLVPLLESEGVAVNARPLDEGRPFWLGLLIGVAPAVVLSAALLWAITRLSPGRGGAFGLGRSRARRYVLSGSRVAFDDVAGIDEVKQEMVEVVDFLRDPEKYEQLGARVPKGVLLVGAPGTGKTLLARAVAGEARVPFFSLSASEFVEAVVGVGASRVRDLFAQAKAEAPAIVFIDELDAIGRARGTGPFAGPGEREQTLNQILVEMDGFEVGTRIVVLAATNRPDVLDAALLRPGRFDRHVLVQRPDRAGREQILRVHARGVPLGPDVSLAEVAAAAPGLVGAELGNLVNEAALRAARRGAGAVGADDLAEALEKITFGAARPVVMAPEDRARVAFHEAGHALVGLLVPEADPVQKVTITARGRALGVTHQVPTDDRHNYSDEYLTARIAIALGGRAAEEIVFGNASTGGQSDLRQATRLARRMVTVWGMSQEIGLVSLDGPDEDGDERALLGQPRWYSEATARSVDRAVRKIIDGGYREATTLLTRERTRLDALAQALLRQGSLNEREILEAVSPSGNADVTAS